MSRALKVLLIVAAIALLLGGLGVLWFMSQAGDEVAERAAAKLQEQLGGTCKIGSAEVLSPSKVAFKNVACTADQGPLVGFAAVHVALEFDGPILRGIPPIQSVRVDGMHVALRSLPMDADADDDDDDSSADTSLSGIVQALAQRYVRTRDWLDERPGGDISASVLSRLADGGTVLVERATVTLADMPQDLPLPEEFSVQLDRVGDVLEVGVAAKLPSGGTVRAAATTSADGLASGELALDKVDLLPLLQRTDAFDVRAATVTGSVQFKAGAESWPLDFLLAGLTVNHPFLGKVPAALPSLGARGDLALSDDGLVLRSGEWTVDEEVGDLDVRFGPLGDEPAVQVHAEGQRLKLGRLLGALPDSILPDDWAKEIQGTMDLDVSFGGPLHDRSAWTLDWDADFSRMILADGELAAQIRRLHGPFEHVIPARAGFDPSRRIIGPTDPHFASYQEISSWLSAAVVSTEDAGFFVHSGFEMSEIKEAMLDNLREGDGRGGSTITQQLAKNLFLSGERTLSRKLKEAVISWRLERDLSKERILEIYLNIAEWGPGIYGIRDAADHYFARTPKVLKPEEAAFLASLLPSPRRYHGYYHGKGRGLTRGRQERVVQILDTMARLGSLDPAQHQRARGGGVELAPCGL